MNNKPRKPWVAGILSLLQPGLGQVYNGEIRKAFLIYVIPLLLIPGMILCLNNEFIRLYFVSYAIFGLAYYALVFLDAVKCARRLNNDYTLKKYNRVIAYIGISVLVAMVTQSIGLAVKTNFVQAFRFPSGSMEPTLLHGDHILVDRRQAARNPKRGDMIVFQYPEDPAKDFVKRVVAIDGDRVEIKDKVLFVNGNQVKEPYVSHREANIVPASENPRDNYGPQMIPIDSYFVLGDNRDRSYDSRFWGAVSKDEVKGTVKNVYWSWDKEKSAVRWERIGLKVQ